MNGKNSINHASTPTSDSNHDKPIEVTVDGPSEGASRGAPSHSIHDLSRAAEKMALEIDKQVHDLQKILPHNAIDLEVSRSIARSISSRNMIYAACIGAAILIFVISISLSILFSDAKDRIALIQEIMPVVTGILGLGAGGGLVAAKLGSGNSSG